MPHSNNRLEINRLQIVSDYRQELMGISAIGIILCHMPFYCTELPGIVKSLFLLGDYGVDMFLLLSGLGIWTSLASSKIKRNVLCYKWGGLFKWYKKRYIRLLVPYCIIMIPFYAWQCTHYNLGVQNFYFVCQLFLFGHHIIVYGL